MHFHDMIFLLGVTIEPFISTDMDVHPERHINRIKVFTHCNCSKYFNRRRPAGFFTEQEKDLFKHSLHHLLCHDIHHNHI